MCGVVALLPHRATRALRALLLECVLCVCFSAEKVNEHMKTNKQYKYTIQVHTKSSPVFAMRVCVFSSFEYYTQHHLRLILKKKLKTRMVLVDTT